MASKSSTLGFEVSSLFEQAAGQFRNLNTREPGQWPALPKMAAWLGVTLAVVVGGWFGLLSGAQDELDSARAREPQLKADYRSRLAQAVNLTELRKQKLQVQEYVTQLEKQLPGKAEMDALLSDINQAGLGRGLQFDLFRPRTVAVKDYYAELPIDLRLSGTYHDIGAFTSDLSNLPRIVTLNNLQVNLDQKSGRLTMDAIAKTFRYLDEEEIAAQRAAQAAKNKPPAGAAK